VVSTTETPAQTWDRLYAERVRLLNLAIRTPDDNSRITDLAHQLRALREQPPPGYTLPAAAASLISHAHTHGWQAGAQWYGLPHLDDADVEPRVVVEAGRQATSAETSRGTRWQYSLTWHSRNCAPGQLRRFGPGNAHTPDEPWHNDAPSLRAIRAVITAHPAPTT
jgi:hypothetical protein